MKRLEIEENGSIFYTRDHRWVNFETGSCGLTRYAFEDALPTAMRYNHSPDAEQRVKKERPAGYFVFEEEFFHFDPKGVKRHIRHTPIISPVTGEVKEINRSIRIDGGLFEGTWLYRVRRVEEWQEGLMDRLTYFSYVMSKK